MLSLSPEQFAHNPHLYLRRLQAVPQLPPPEKSPQTYLTQWGTISFDALYEQTYRYAAKVLRDKLSPDAVEDGLQTGYLRLYEQLQDNPELLSGRPLAWIGKFILYSAYRNECRSETRNLQSADLEFDDPSDVTPIDFAAGISGGFGRHSDESRRSDTRHDILEAIRDTANYLLTEVNGVAQQRALWALYSITALQIQVTEASRLFGVRHQSMRAAYDLVTAQLQARLIAYKPATPTKRLRAKRETLPEQNITAIRVSNEDTPPIIYQRVRDELCADPPPTIDRDLIALEGIQSGVAAQVQGRRFKIPKSSMQRAYERVHLRIAAQTDSTVRPKRVTRRRMQSFEMNDAVVPMLQQLATELASETGNFVPVIALYAYVCNLPNRAVSRDFGVNEGTLRRHRYQVQERLVHTQILTL